ncbi:hypothetical protein P7C73_g2176, partial [Tremellales sp. Uapishka_1]
MINIIADDQDLHIELLSQQLQQASYTGVDQASQPSSMSVDPTILAPPIDRKIGSWHPSHQNQDSTPQQPIARQHEGTATTTTPRSDSLSSASRDGSVLHQNEKPGSAKDGSASTFIADNDRTQGEKSPGSKEGKTSGGEEKWSFANQIKQNQAVMRENNISYERSLSLAYSHLSVRGEGGVDEVTYGPTVGAIIAPWTNRKYKKKAKALADARVAGEEKGGVEGQGARGDGMVWQEGGPKLGKHDEGLRQGERYLLKDFSGLVRAGEMMLVVGRPGSGCTTFLKTLSGLNHGYAGVDGTVMYGDMVEGKKFNPYRSEVVYNSEEDIHDANLLVDYTMDYALRMNSVNEHVRLPGPDGKHLSKIEAVAKAKEELLRVHGLSHTNRTKVGDQYTRGVSGGEKKRVSLAEVMAASASIQAYDAPTRGLDGSSALRFIKTLRTLADVERKTIVVTAYQAGNDIYDSFEKVTVIAEGRLIYYGWRKDAQAYFEGLGFEHIDGGNTADYLTAVTATNERKIKSSHKGKVPTSPAEFADLYASSDIARKMREELEAYMQDEESRKKEGERTRALVLAEKNKGASKKGPEKESFATQVKTALIRDYQQRWGDQWFGWFRWVNPVYYAFEALISQELTGLTLTCIEPNLFPPTAAAGQQGCALAGSTPNSIEVDATIWLSDALNMSQIWVWRNLGIILAIWIFFVFMGMVMTDRIPAAGSEKAILLYRRGGGGKYIRAAATENGNAPRDVEEGSEDTQPVDNRGDNDKPADSVAVADTVFTWKNLNYTVSSDGKDLQLLDNVSGFCRPGLTALMGASGAGKTTLMDVLALRKTDGVITGEVLMNGLALPISFQRTTGWIYIYRKASSVLWTLLMPSATVREALEFSALLRQPRSLSDKEKLEYVDVILDLLELRDIEDALIGVPGAGLGVEQRKRVTIGVELVSKPSLLFLDEPTSGLDGQSSYLIVSFLKKLAAAGQSVLCTIHQPSATLFGRFDQLLLLKKGGKTVYFGKIEDDLAAYFSENGAPIPKGANPAEFMIDVVSGELSTERDWAQVWSESKNCETMMKDLDELNKTNAGKEREEHVDDSYQFASTTSSQLKLVTKRASVQLWRNTDYVMSKVMLHIGSALFNGFSFWMIGNSYANLQQRLFTIFQFIFVAPGQPKFIANRDIFEAREKKAKLYHWSAFVTVDPFNFLLGGMLVFPIWNVPVKCADNEFGIFDPPSGQTCGAYTASFLEGNNGYINNPDATSSCQFCPYSQGNQYLASLNLGRHVFGWRDICITFLFSISSYALVYLLLKLRSKQSKKAE